MNLRVKIKRMHEASVIPQYAREGDAGLDLIACEDVIIEPGETKIVPTGIAISLPPGYEAQIRPRSGITVKTKLRVQLGTIDSGYTGEIGVIVDNISPTPKRLCHYSLGVDGKEHDTFEYLKEGTYVILKGDRIAQCVIAPVLQAQFVEADELSETSRGSNGFGSSGVKS
jgi:dUTP pyrophosphatase